MKNIKILAIISLILASQGNLFAMGKDSVEAQLIRAANAGTEKTVERLISECEKRVGTGLVGRRKRSAFVNAKDEHGLTALHYAARKGHFYIACYLIAKGAKVNLKDNMGRTALFEAANNGHLHIAGLLIAKGAKVNVKNSMGRTALHSAAASGSPYIIRLLIVNGAKAYMDKSERKPIDVARKSRRGDRKDVIDLLEGL